MCWQRVDPVKHICNITNRVQNATKKSTTICLTSYITQKNYFVKITDKNKKRMNVSKPQMIHNDDFSNSFLLDYIQSQTAKLDVKE